LDRDARMSGDQLRHPRREDVPIDRECGTGGNPRLFRRREEQRSERRHFRLEETMRIRRIGALERVGANQFRQPVGLVRGGAAYRTHLDERDVVASLRELPRRLTPREPASDDGDLRQSYLLSCPIRLTVLRLRARSCPARTPHCTAGTSGNRPAPSCSSPPGTHCRNPGKAQAPGGPSSTTRSPGSACSPRIPSRAGSSSPRYHPRRTSGTSPPGWSPVPCACTPDSCCTR